MTARPRKGGLSPSLLGTAEGATPAFELKFVLAEPAAAGLASGGAADA